MLTYVDLDNSTSPLGWEDVSGAIANVGGLPVVILSLDKTNNIIGSGRFCESLADVQTCVVRMLAQSPCNRIRILARKNEEKSPKEIDWFAINKEFG